MDNAPRGSRIAFAPMKTGEFTPEDTAMRPASRAPLADRGATNSAGKLGKTSNKMVSASGGAGKIAGRESRRRSRARERDGVAAFLILEDEGLRNHPFLA
ncbi:hypothetical protein B7486_15225 [cyanobacterium TDX16]|nr:hypothetical protein B7486_15225 [cyanobacterium TDX16]